MLSHFSILFLQEHQLVTLRMISSAATCRTPRTILTGYIGPGTPQPQTRVPPMMSHMEPAMVSTTCGSPLILPHNLFFFITVQNFIFWISQIPFMLMKARADWTRYAVTVQTSLAPLSWFPGSRIPTAHVHQCCRFQSYVKTVPSRMKSTTKLTKREPTLLGSMTMDHVITACDVWL